MTYQTKEIKHAELLGLKVTLQHMAGVLEAEIDRVSDTSIWATFTHPNGNKLRLRFTERAAGGWKQHGKGQHSASLVFVK